MTRLVNRREAGLPAENQLVVILTDGMENHSRERTQEQIFNLIAARRSAGWEFAFTGANQDSYATRAGLGVAAGNVSDFAASPDGLDLTMASVSRAAGSYRRKHTAARMRSAGGFFEGAREAERSRPRRG